MDLLDPFRTVLHITSASCYVMCALLKSNRAHASSCASIIHELSIIVSNAEDKAWSQHRHLKGHSDLKDAIINLSPHGGKVLCK